jgi:GAF domain-containing protein
VAHAVLDEHRLRRLIDVGRGLLAQLDLEAVLREVVEVARELTGARYAALGILDEGRGELERFIYVGIDEETRAQIGEQHL